MTEAHKALRVVVATLCAYEVVAITLRKTPTLTKLNRRCPAIAPAILAGLAIHFYKEIKEPDNYEQLFPTCE
jgi:hypothetical protein